MWEDEEDFLDLWGATPCKFTEEIFDKLDKESATLKQDLEELHEDLERLKEKHGEAELEFDEKYDSSTFDIFPYSSSYSYIMALVDPNHEDNMPSTLMSLFPFLSSSKVMATMYPDTTDRPGNHLQLTPWPPDSSHLSTITFTCVTLAKLCEEAICNQNSIASDETYYEEMAYGEREDDTEEELQVLKKFGAEQNLEIKDQEYHAKIFKEIVASNEKGDEMGREIELLSRKVEHIVAPPPVAAIKKLNKLLNQSK